MADQTQHRTAVEALPIEDVRAMIVHIHAALERASLTLEKGENTPINWGRYPARNLAEGLLIRGVKP